MTAGRPPGPPDPVDAAVRAVYAAALDARRWPDAVAAVARACEASAASFFSPKPVVGLATCMHNIDPAGVLAYEQHWFSRDEWVAAGMRLHGMAAGTCSLGDELIGSRQLMRTGFGHDFAHRYGLDRMMGSVLFDAATPEVAPPTLLSVFRDAGRPGFEQADRRRMRRLMPHLQRAIETQWRLRLDSGQQALSVQALDRLDDALFLLGADARLVQLNARAEALRAGGRNVELRGDRLERIGRRSLPPVADAIARATEDGVVVPLLIELADGALPLVRGSLHPLAPGAPLGLADAPALMLIVQLPHRPSAALLAQVGRLYGFTPAEQRVALLLLEGKTMAEVAAALDVRPSTVKTQVAALLAKGGFDRVVDLVRALSSLG